MKIKPFRYEKRAYPTSITLPQLFEKRVKTKPESVAVVFKGTRLTYGELNSKANQLARCLRKLGVGPDTTVAVSMHRSYEVYIALIAIQKAGGAYVAIEPFNPESRLKFLIEDSNPIIILTQKTLEEKFKDCGKDIFCIDTDWDKIKNEDIENLPLNINENNLSDIIYTSGSTGLPKGVASTHKNRINAVFAWEEIYGLSDKDILFQTTSLGFDVFTADYTRTFSLGATIVPSEDNFTLTQNASIERMYELLVEENVNFAEFNVTTIRKLFSYAKENKKPLDFLKIIVVGADAWYLTEDKDLSEYCKGNTKIYNSYGVTEEAVDSTYFEKSMIKNSNDPKLSNKSLIGIPFPNTKVYLLNDKLKPVKKGEVGTLYFGGPNTARGYLNRDDLTKQRFIQNPFEDNDEKIYNSGDLARITEDDVIEFLGRSDFQVEINSKRVEISEVEAALLKHIVVREVVVVGVKRENRDTALIAYISFHKNKKIEIEELKNFSRLENPEYMIPSIFIIMEAFPLNASGKVDRKALPVPMFDNK